ncbi:GDSL-type esterase/lipase family protein [Sphingobacterium luzhongxinii]|uniref:GDSL-type esterase/lipase family protein n=1 Tax=Sphingobacterium luzhongxinii TaxID=2654181 RepID=UPI0013DA7E25|nr:GDSL-type esterase/lipase family protein [Sphingobacterium sp. xlx-73]
MSIKSVLVIVFLLINMLAKAQVATSIDSNYVFSGYTERLEQYRKMPTLRGAIIFLGNSLTDAGKWNDIAPELPILNRGISGDISYGVLARLDEVLRHQPRKLFLMIGVNDLKRGIPTSNIIQNYERIVRRIQKESPKTRIYLNSILPIHPEKLIESFKSVTNADVSKLNDGLKLLAKSDKNIQFVDLHKVVADKQGNLKPEITPDGIHLEVAAYVDLVNYLKDIKAL